ncbi:MAG: GIY-YIG nuclease family protein [Candidatus Taylorbacteria bacterium]|nr:GIY-YIG nuclease family protein [Candidatus Taylorbacteria bacterium]
MTNGQLKEQVNKLPANPGIYIFRSGKNKPLYIGKALDLKNRLKAYLKTEDARLQKMLLEANKISFVKTGSDIEALILESQYIKKYQPAFNIMLRDDKQYGFVGFTEDVFPKIFITHQPTHFQKQGFWKTSYIGPFTDIGALKTTLRLLRKIFPYCTCQQPHNNYCLNYHIEKCLGYCCLKNNEHKNNEQKTYSKNIKAIKEILSGKKESLIKHFEKEMKNLSDKQEFEKALELQYKIEKLKRVFANAKIINNNLEVMIYHNSQAKIIELLQKFLNLPSLPRRIEAYDIANIQGKHAVGAMVVFINGQPDKNQYRKFKIRMFGSSTSKHSGGDTGMLREILERRFNHPEWPFPDLIVVDGGKAQLSAVSAAISKSESLNPKQIQNSKLKIPIIALTKNERHIGEKIYIANKPSYPTFFVKTSKVKKATAGKKDLIPLSQLPRNVKNLLLHINSEAHRFAISYYRNVHRKKALRPY